MMLGSKKVNYLFLTLILANLLVWSTLSELDREGVLTVAFLDVGQGDAIFIESPTGRQVLIDGGPDRQILPALGALMPFTDRSLDLLLISNPDKDHIGGFLEVLARYRVASIIEPGTKTETAVYAALREELERQNIRRLLLRGGSTIPLGGGATLTILFPDRNMVSWKTNEGSLIARLDYGETSFLFTGDAPASTERLLLATLPAALDVDILKVGHHGSKTSSAPAFLAAVTPEMAVISSGASNRYGHPHPEVLKNLAAVHSQTFRTDERGTIIFCTDGKSYWTSDAR